MYEQKIGQKMNRVVLDANTRLGEIAGPRLREPSLVTPSGPGRRIHATKGPYSDSTWEM